MSRLQACMKSQPDAALKASMAEAESMGVKATPTMFINGQKLEGAVDADEVKAVLEPATAGGRDSAPAGTACRSAAGREVVDGAGYKDRTVS